MEQQQSHEARIGAELARLRTDLDKLKSRVEKNEKNDSKMIEYLEQIETKRKKLDEKLEQWKDTGADASEELALGLKDAWNRLAIATRAARARLH